MDLKKTFKKHRKLFIFLAVLILLALLLYFYTYFFTEKTGKVIYQDAARRIYLTEKGPYKKQGNANAKERELWRMVYEDKKTGNRWFVLGNSPVGFPAKDMARIVLNTMDQSRGASFDQVARVGVTIRKANTDIHSNLVDKKDAGDVLKGWDKELNKNSVVFA
jgi:flagellar basal body-associated protein FliL